MDTKERDAIIAKLIEQGLSLSDVQKALRADHDISITYMELRLIASDLEVTWAKQDAAKLTEAQKDLSKLPPDPLDDPEAAGTTRVTVSKLVRPGAIYSGDVVFGSGGTAEWWVDRQGRLGLNPADETFKPTPEDIEEFQMELQRVLQGPA